jgi:hypothetical protein
MVQENQFCGLPSEDASADLQHFLELCDTIIIKDVALASIRLCLFPKTVVLLEQGSGQHVGQILCDIPGKIFPHGKNQCPAGEDFKLLVDFTQVHP